MDYNDIYVLGIFAVAFVIVYVAQVFGYRQLAESFRALVETTYPQADRALAPYGDKLTTANRLFVFLDSLVDEDTDELAKYLTPRHRALLHDMLSRAENLTDGVPLAERPPEPEQEHAPNAPQS